MSSRTKRLIILLAIVQIIFAAGLFSLPRIVEALPVNVRYRLPTAISDLATTPVPTALPAPVLPAGETTGAIPSFAFEETPEPTPTDLPPTATATFAAVETAVPATPTAVPPTATPTAPPPTPTPIVLPVNILLDGLQNIPQRFNNCGPANMSIVLNYHGDATTQTDAALFLKPNPEDRNVSPWQISDYVNNQTALRSAVHSGGTLEMLKRFVAIGLPVVVEKGFDPPTDEGWYGHYLTVFGYDDERRELYSLDTYLGPFAAGTYRTDSYDELDFYWQQFNYTFYVVYEPERQAEVEAILGAEMLDAVAMWQYTAVRARDEIEVNDQDAFAWFNLGTSLTRLGEITGDLQYYEGGASAFDTARTIGLPGRMLWYQFRPYVAYMRTGRYQDMLDLADSTLSTAGGRNVEESYLYRGHALTFLGDVGGAIAAFERALELNENFYVAQWALDSLR